MMKSSQRGVPGLSALLLDLNGRLLQRFAGHRERVNAVAFSPEGRFLLTGSGLSNTELREGESARLWDTQSNLLFSYFADEPVVGVDFSGDGKHWVTAEGHSLRLWKTSQGIHEWLREAPIDSLPVAEIDSLLALGSSEPESEQGLWSSLAVSWRYLTQWLDGS